MAVEGLTAQREKAQARQKSKCDMGDDAATWSVPTTDLCVLLFLRTRGRSAFGSQSASDESSGGALAPSPHVTAARATSR